MQTYSLNDQYLQNVIQYLLYLPPKKVPTSVHNQKMNVIPILATAVFPKGPQSSRHSQLHPGREIATWIKCDAVACLVRSPSYKVIACLVCFFDLLIKTDYLHPYINCVEDFSFHGKHYSYNSVSFSKLYLYLCVVV